MGLIMKSILIIAITILLFLTGCNNSSQPLAIEEDKPIVTTVEDAATETTSEIDNQEVVIDDAAEETITTISELFMKHNL